MIATTIVCDYLPWQRVLPQMDVICHEAATEVRALVHTMPSQIVIALLSDQQMRALNLRHRQRAYAADVLSFSYEDMGEIALGFGRLWRDSRKDRVMHQSYVRWLVVHGMLHVCGYDHEHAAEARRMATMEKRILRQWR